MTDVRTSLTGRVLVAGTVEAPSLRCTAPISGWGGIDPRTGVITEIVHPQRGESFAGRVLVIPGAKGSSGWSGQFHLAKMMGTAPAAIITSKVNSKLAVGLVALAVPAILVDDLSPFPADGSRIAIRGGGAIELLSQPG